MSLDPHMSVGPVAEIQRISASAERSSGRGSGQAELPIQMSASDKLQTICIIAKEIEELRNET